MNRDPNQYPISFEIWCREHPEKFGTRRRPAKIALYGLGSVACILLTIFPQVIPLFPLWMIRTAAILLLLLCLICLWVDGTCCYNKESGGSIRRIGLKKFDRVSTDADEIMAAFDLRDFDFLADAAETDNEPLQLYVYEDAVGREFYLQLRTYVDASNFRGISDVLTVSGREYDEYQSVIRSIHPDKD